MNYTLQDQIQELKNRIINYEIDIDLLDPRKQAGKYQLLKCELEVLRRELRELEKEVK